MQKLKSKVFQKFQIKTNVQYLKTLPSSPAFQLFVTSSLLGGLLLELQIRPLGLLFLMLICFWLFRSRCNLRLQIPAEFGNRVNALQKRIVEYRQVKPTMFCMIASGCLAALAVVGHFVSGSVVVLSGLILAGVISTRHNIKIIKIKPEEFSFEWPRKVHQEYDFDDEFLPEENEFNMFCLEKANDLSSRIEDAEDDESKSDEIPSELLIPDAIPEVDESSTEDDQDDLLPIVPASKSQPYIENSNPTKDALVKYSHLNDTIEFKKSHFKRDSSLSTSSSSSEECLSKGLQFPDHTAVDGPKAERPMTRSHQREVSNLVDMIGSSEAQNFIANNSKLIPTLVTSLVQGVLGVSAGAPTQDTSNRRLVTALDSSDESDFEILEKEDFQ